MLSKTFARWALVAAVAAALCGYVVALNTATIATDMPDYYPGDTVVITGTGWEPGETVRLAITQVSPPVADPTTVLVAEADSAGNVENADFRILEDHLGAAFVLQAEGLSSGLTATTHFTDSPRIGNVQLGPQTPSPVFAGSQATYSVTVNRGSGGGSAGNFNAALSITGLPANVSGSFVTTPLPFPPATSTNSTTLTLTVGSTVPTGSYPFTVRAQVTTNAGDFATVNGVLSVVNDGIAPTTTATPSVAPNGNGWNNTNVSVGLSAADNVGGSGVKEIVYSASGAHTIGLTTVAGNAANIALSNEGTTTITFFARDNAGNVEVSQNLIVRIDKTAPVLTQGATTGTAGNSGWYLSNVSVAYTASDALSGLDDAADASFSLSTSGDGAASSTDSRTVFDKAGNSAVAGPHTFMVDTAAPDVTQGAITGEQGDDDWYRTDVSAAFSATDDTSGLASAADASFSLNAAGEGPSVASDSRTVYDVAGNSTTVGPLSFKIDKTPPQLNEGAPSGTSGTNGWYVSAVTVHWSAFDGLSGLKEPGDASFDLTTSGEGTGVGTGSRLVYDVAGNVATAEERFFDVDLTDPSLVAVPDRPANANGWYTAPVEVVWQATDGASGIASVSAPEVYSGPDSDTAIMSGSATDNAGRTTHETFNLRYDATKPTILVTGLDANYLREATISTSASDLFLNTHIVLLNGVPQDPDEPLIVAVEGSYTLEVRATDLAGNEEVVIKTFTIDQTAPVILFGVDWPAENTYYSVSKTLEYSLEVPDDFFVTELLRRSLLAGDFTQQLASGYIAADEARYGVELLARDFAGNETASNRTFFIDLTPPDILIEPIGTPGANGWFVGGSLSAYLSSMDPLIREASGALDEILGSGVFSITYSADGATSIGETTEETTTQQVSLDEGITTVYLRSADVAGNGSSMIALQVKYDKTPPEIEEIDDLTVEATGPTGAAVVLPTAIATDNLSAVSFEYSHVSGSTFSLGETTVVVTASDEAGNTSNTSFKVTVVDTTPPTIIGMPGNLVLEATSPAGAIATFASPTATDLVDANPSVELDHLSGETFPIGETTVTAIARDFSGNEATATFTITVQDTTPPTLSLPADVTVEGNALGGANVHFSPTAEDIVDGARPVTTNPLSGSLFPLGTTAVQAESSDTRGNTANGSFNVTVVDATPPAFADVPADMVVEATGPSGAPASFALPSASDVVWGPVGVTSSHASGSTFPLGDTIVTFYATDGSGNPAQATFKITVRDTTPAALSLPTNLTLIATSSVGAVATYSASAFDLVDGSIPVSFSIPSGSVFPLGTTTVTGTATDNAGNMATGSFTVTVVYGWSNVLKPINLDGSSMFKLNSTVPVKFQLTGDSGGIPDAVVRLFVSKLSDTATGVEMPADSTAASTTGNLFRYDPTSDQYIFNLGTKGLSTGRWRLRIDMGDGVLRTVEISLK